MLGWIINKRFHRNTFPTQTAFTSSKHLPKVDTCCSIQEEKRAKAIFHLFLRHFLTDFQAHDALVDMRALRRVLFESPLKLIDADIINNSNLKQASFAFEEMLYLDECFVRMQTSKFSQNY